MQETKTDSLSKIRSSKGYKQHVLSRDVDYQGNWRQQGVFDHSS